MARFVLLVLTAAVVMLPACAEQQRELEETTDSVVEETTEQVEDCLDRDGCQAEAGTPLRNWDEPWLYVWANHGGVGWGPRLFVMLAPGEPFPICPSAPEGITATIDGVRLIQLDTTPVPFACPELFWELRGEDWPEESGPISIVEVTDGETNLRLEVPYSMTAGRGWTSPEEPVEPGAELVLSVDGLVPRQATVSDARLQTQRGDYILAAELEGNEVRMELPDPLLAERGFLDFQVEADMVGDCPGTGLCTAELTLRYASGFDVVAQ